MKPTTTIGHQARLRDSSRPSVQTRKAPITDWSFHAPSPSFSSGSSALRTEKAGLHPAFHTLSDSFFATEAKREFRLEGALFAAIVAMTAWPLVLAAQAAAALVK